MPIVISIKIDIVTFLSFSERYLAKGYCYGKTKKSSVGSSTTRSTSINCTLFLDSMLGKGCGWFGTDPRWPDQNSRYKTTGMVPFPWIRLEREGILSVRCARLPTVDKTGACVFYFAVKWTEFLLTEELTFPNRLPLWNDRALMLRRFPCGNSNDQKLR